MLLSQGVVPIARVPLISRVYLTIASWKRALSPGLDDDTIQGAKNFSLFDSQVFTFSFVLNIIMIFFKIRLTPVFASKWCLWPQLWIYFLEILVSQKITHQVPRIGGPVLAPWNNSTTLYKLNSSGSMRGGVRTRYRVYFAESSPDDRLDEIIYSFKSVKYSLMLADLM